jgi:cbb3-type cytochrome c oxidase subunit III
MKKFLVVSILAAGILLTGCTSLAGDIQPPADYAAPVVEPPVATAAAYPLVPPSIASGEAVYGQYCAACHGQLGNGDGQSIPSSGTSPAALAHPSNLRATVPQEWFEITKGGKGSMPGFSTKLTDRQIWDAIAYLLSLENKPEQMVAGREIFITVCSQCHGETGKGDGELAGELTFPPTDFTNQSIMAAISNQGMVDIITNGRSNVMPAFGAMFSEDDKWAAVTYIRSLAFADVVLPEVTPAAVEATLAPDAQIAPQPTAEVAATPGTKLVTISGQIIHDSGGQIPADAAVSLLIFDNMTQSGEQKTTADAQGFYRFENVEMPAGRIFITAVDYSGQTFSSQPSLHPGVAADEAQTAFDLPIHVYDGTTDTSVVSADRLHLFMDFNTPGIVQVIELYIISNHSNQVLTAAEAGGPVLSFHLPEGAENLLFQDSTLGERYLAIEGGFADTNPVLPGEASHQVLFMFDLPYTNRLKISLPVSVNVESVNVMLPEGNIKMKSSQLVDGGVRQSQGMNYALFTGDSIPAGGTLEMEISGKTSAAATDTSTDSGNRVNPILLGGGILLLTLTGVGFYFFELKKKNQTETVQPAEDGLTDRDAIMDAIIALDALHAEGKITDAAYQSRRSELKDKLKGIL